MKEFCYSATGPLELWKQFITFCAEHELGWSNTVLVTFMSGDEDEGSEELTVKEFVNHISIQTLANETHRRIREKAEDETLDLF